MNLDHELPWPGGRPDEIVAAAELLVAQAAESARVADALVAERAALAAVRSGWAGEVGALADVVREQGRRAYAGATAYATFGRQLAEARDEVARLRRQAADAEADLGERATYGPLLARALEPVRDRHRRVLARVDAQARTAAARLVAAVPEDRDETSHHALTARIEAAVESRLGVLDPNARSDGTSVGSSD